MSDVLEDMRAMLRTVQRERIRLMLTRLAMMQAWTYPAQDRLDVINHLYEDVSRMHGVKEED